MSVLITGASGFVGRNLLTFLRAEKVVTEVVSLRDKSGFSISKDTKVIVHLSGKAHDLKRVINASEYYEVNTELTKLVYKAFCESKADIFIYMSSVKAVADSPTGIVNEETTPEPFTVYGKSKLAAEDYLIRNQKAGTRLFILRPCMIHGPNNKGNLNLLFKFVKKGIPYPLGSFSNKRSFLSVGNLGFIINELIKNKGIKSGIYTLADSEALSTIDVIKLIGESLGKNARILSVPTSLIWFIAKIGNKLKLPLTTERLQKLTESYMVSNEKIVKAIGQELPINSKEGFLSTFNSFN